MGTWISYPSSPTNPIRSTSAGTPATSIVVADRYGTASPETSASVSERITSRDAGPARFTAA